ncbi:unnamed protein product [Alopecurus aequalis]
MNATLMTPDGVSRLWEWDPDVARKALVRMVVLHEFPLSIVEYDGFRKFVKSLNPSFNMISRRTLKNDITKEFDELKKDLKELFGASKSRISLTMDMWISNQTIGYMVITSHFINDNWKLEKRIIKFNALETPHTGVAMFNVVLKCIRDLNFEDKLFAITLDNASNNGRMVKMLRENLVGKNMLLAGGRFLHQRCAAHILNLVCQAGIAYLDPILTNIRDTVKFIKVTANRKEKFADIVTQKGISCEKSLCLDVPTRWNSTFTMLTIAMRYRRAFEALESQDPQYTYAPSAEEWDETREVCKLLKVFYEATNVVSGSKYPTSNLYFQQMWQANVASMARDVLAVPASTVASESAFSTGRRVISDFRSRLTPDTVESLICLQDWFRTSSTSDLSTASVYDILGDEGLNILPDIK